MVHFNFRLVWFYVLPYYFIYIGLPFPAWLLGRGIEQAHDAFKSLLSEDPGDHFYQKVSELSFERRNIEDRRMFVWNVFIRQEGGDGGLAQVQLTQFWDLT